MADIFISYSNKDRAVVEKVAKRIEEHGYSIWWDFKLIGGVRFRPTIQKELHAAKAVLVVWTSHSIESPWVEEEADEAVATDKLVPVIEDGLGVRDIPIGFRNRQMCRLSDIDGILKALEAKFHQFGYTPEHANALAPERSEAPATDGAADAAAVPDAAGESAAPKPDAAPEIVLPAADGTSRTVDPQTAVATATPKTDPVIAASAAQKGGIDRRAVAGGLLGLTAAAGGAAYFLIPRGGGEAPKVAKAEPQPPHAAPSPPPVTATASIEPAAPATAGRIEPLLSGATILRSVAFSPSTPQLAIGGEDGAIRLFDVESAMQLRVLGTPGRAAAAKSLCYSKDGSRLACAHIDGNIQIWDLSSYAVTFQATSEQRLYGIGYYPNEPDRYFVVGGTKSVEIWNMKRGRVEGTIKLHDAPVRSIAFAQDRDGTFASAGEDGQIVFFLANNKQVPVRASKKGVFSVAFSPDNSMIVSGSADGLVRIWDVGSRTVTRELPGHSGYILSVAFSSDGRKIVSGGSDRIVRVWDVASGALAESMPRHQADVECVAFSSRDGHVVSVSEDKSLRLWRADSGELILTCVCFADGEFVAFSPAGPYSASAGADRYLGVVAGGQAGPVSAQFRSSHYKPGGLGNLLSSLP